MPKLVTRKYYFVDKPQKVLVYSQKEMADALGVTEAELVAALTKGIGLQYHAHPNSGTEDGGYEFIKECFDHNIQVWACVQNGGHHFVFDHYYDEDSRKANYKCTNCPAERFSW
jgi:hypothetical protein